MTYRDFMTENSSDNAGYCKPMFSADNRVQFALHDGKIDALIIDGQEVKATPENIEKAARILNTEYDDYEGWDDTHILLDGDPEERACCECPWFDVCAAMDDDMEF